MIALVDSNHRQAAGHGSLQESMNKTLWMQAPSDEDNVASIEPDLLDRIQIWMNEGGAGDDAR